MLNDLQFRRSPNCSKFSLLVSSKDPFISDYELSDSSSPSHTPSIAFSGKDLHEEYFLQHGFNYPILVKDSKENIDLKLPSNVRTLQDIARIIGSDFQVKVRR